MLSLRLSTQNLHYISQPGTVYVWDKTNKEVASAVRCKDRRESLNNIVDNDPLGAEASVRAFELLNDSAYEYFRDIFCHTVAQKRTPSRWCIQFSKRVHRPREVWGYVVCRALLVLMHYSITWLTTITLGDEREG
jgi:hypothetical protein